MMKQKKHVLQAVALLVVLSVLLMICVSQVFSCHHRCISEDCLVCFVLSVYDRLLRAIMAIAFFATLALLLASPRLAGLSKKGKMPWLTPTLVALRVELRD